MSQQHFDSKVWLIQISLEMEISRLKMLPENKGLSPPKMQEIMSSSSIIL